MSNVNLEEMSQAIQPVVTHVKPNSPDDDEKPDIDEIRGNLSNQLEQLVLSMQNSSLDSDFANEQQ